ncbi:amidohydrolase family protein [Schlesneria paludicola]|uniref:amidohydrolase family protein n=1 Tax=Schlesneria paludicola TaxID=360056 RepID=UPI00029A1761|nr:amidohydrolase family protein [Schlesneria paludicola]
MKNSGYLIKNGEVHNGLGGPAERVDIRVTDGVISEISSNLAPAGDKLIEADGLIVAPGLIDLHTHVFSGIGLYSVDPVDAGLRTGVTSMLDTGTAGSLTYPNFERFIIRPADEDIYALLNISMIGAIQGHPEFPPFMGDLNDGRHADVPSAVQCALKYPDRIVGMKVRLTSGLANFEEKNELAGFHGVFAAAEQLGLPCMIHHAASRIPNTTVLKALRAGDTYTHLYHPHPDHAFDPDGAPIEALLEARARGVLFDVGHGLGAFVWRVAEPACQKFGFWPDTISTDIHQFNLKAPVVDLPTTMSKFLYLGMPLEQIIRASTFLPASAMGKQDRLGSLQAGKQADIVLLKRQRGEFPLTDSESQTRIASERLIAVSVCKRGKWTACQPGAKYPAYE